MLAMEEFENMESIQTPTRKFPMKVTVEKKKWKFKVTFTDNLEQGLESQWLWKGKLMDKRNRKHLEETLEKAEEQTQSALTRAIRRDMMEIDRKRQVEAKINRMFGW